MGWVDGGVLTRLKLISSCRVFMPIQERHRERLRHRRIWSDLDIERDQLEIDLQGAETVLNYIPLAEPR